MSVKPSDIKIPGTLKRSPKKAQRTYAKTLAAAESEYGVGERASRTAYSSLKHSYEKVDDHWEAKDHKGPSRPAGGQERARGARIDPADLWRRRRARPVARCAVPTRQGARHRRPLDHAQGRIWRRQSRASRSRAATRPRGRAARRAGAPDLRAGSSLAQNTALKPSVTSRARAALICWPNDASRNSLSRATAARTPRFHHADSWSWPNSSAIGAIGPMPVCSNAKPQVVLLACDLSLRRWPRLACSSHR